MSERIKKIVGDENYDKIKELLGDKIEIDNIDIVKDNYVTLSRFNKVNGEVSNLKSQIETASKSQKNVDKILKGLNAENVDEALQNYNTEKAKLKAENEKANLKNIDLEKNYLAESYLRNEKVNDKNLKLLMNSLDFEKISLDNGNLVGIQEQVDIFKKDYIDMFPKTNKNSANTNNTGNSNNNNDNNDDNFTGDIYDQLLSNHGESSF